MRDAISDSERNTLVKLLKNGVPWEKVRRVFPDVDPVALDKNFKDWAMDKAGVKSPPKPEPAKAAATPKKPDPLG